VSTTIFQLSNNADHCVCLKVNDNVKKFFDTELFKRLTILNFQCCSTSVVFRVIVG